MLNLKSLNASPELLKLITEIDEFKGSWSALENHTTALQLLGNVAHFGQNVHEISEALYNKEINAKILMGLHQAFIVKNNPDISTGFRTQNFPVVVQQGETIIGTLETAPPEEIDGLIPKLLEWLDESLREEAHHPLVIIALFMVVFLQIGPFEKGNQKLIRLLVLLLMMKAGYSYAPYAPLDDIMSSRARAYFDVMQSTQDALETGKPDWQSWLIFFMEMAKAQKDKLQVQMQAKGKDLGSLPALSIKIMKLFSDHNRLQMKQIVKLTKGRRSTIKLRLNELVDSGYLRRHGQARSTWYSQT